MKRHKQHGKKYDRVKLPCSWPGCDNDFFISYQGRVPKVRYCAVHNFKPPTVSRRSSDNDLLRRLGFMH